MAGLMGRCRQLNQIDKPEGSTVLYVMMRDQRVRANHALAEAQAYAAQHDLSFAIVFCLQHITSPVAREHYEFMLDGLKEVEAELQKKDMPLLFHIGKSSDILPALIKKLDTRAVFFDFSPLRGPRALRESIATQNLCEVFEVDTHNAVPVWEAYPKQAVGARVLRPKIHAMISDYIDMPNLPAKQKKAWTHATSKLSAQAKQVEAFLSKIPKNNTVHGYTAGEQAASRKLTDFIDNRLLHYADDRNDPSKDGLSGLSPYLHYGQLSSLQVITKARAALAENGRLREGFDALFEEMIVRKDLSDNFCHYNRDYDKLRGAPEWAQKTIEKHADDEREFMYTPSELEKAKTHDDAWNASQRQLMREGKIHGYMRMYWAKKVLEWSPSNQAALQRLLYLNDFYHLDGRDPNGYVGIMWSIAGVHDRPWGERPIFGVIRYMAATGLKRKFDIQAYVEQYPADTQG